MALNDGRLSIGRNSIGFVEKSQTVYDFGLETNRHPCQAFIFVSGKLSIQSVLGKQKKCAGT